MAELLDKLRAYGADMDGAMERFMDDRALYADCLDVFLHDPAFDELDEAMKNKDYEAAFASAYTLKGVSANMGLSPFTVAISALVEALRAHRTEHLEPLYEAVLREIRRVRAL